MSEEILLKNTDKKKSIFDLKRSEIIKRFEQKGVIIFREFDIVAKKIKKFTDLFTETYAKDALRRKKRLNDSDIRDVDYQENIHGEPQAVDLHSEASFAPAWPEIIWFYCITPPQTGGASILCDGAELWNYLSAKTKIFFLFNPIRYELEIPIGIKKRGKGKSPWMLNSLGTGNGFINWKTGIFHLTLQRLAVQEGRNSNQLCFANHLFITLDSEPQLIKRTMFDGKKIAKNILKEIHCKANELTYEHNWKKGDLIMLDNKRFLHGRRKYKKNDPRDIVVIQSAKASFGYGSTTRNRIDR